MLLNDVALRTAMSTSFMPTQINKYKHTFLSPIQMSVVILMSEQ